MHVTPKVRVRLAGTIQENVALAAVRDLVAPSLERFAKDRGQADAQQVERREDVNGANVGRRRMLGREGEPLRQGRSDARIAEDQVCLREGSDGPRLPKGAPGVRRRTVGIDGPVPISDEVVKTPILSLHVEDELHEAVRPLTEAAITGVAIEIEEEHDGACRVIDARNALEALVAGREAVVFVVRVHAQGDGARSDGGNAPCEPCQLPDHFGHGSRLATISRTEKSAAAMHESAAP